MHKTTVVNKAKIDLPAKSLSDSPSLGENLLFSSIFFSCLLPTAAQSGLSLLLLGWFLIHKAWQDRIAWKALAPLSLGILLNAIFLLSCLEMTNIGKSAEETLRLIGKQGFFGILLIMAMAGGQRRGLSLTRHLKWLNVAFFVHLLYLLAQRYWGLDWVHGLGAHLPSHRFSYGVYRCSGFMGHPLSLAYNLMMLLCVGVVFGLREKKRDWWIFVAILLVSLLLTGSRWPLALVGIFSTYQFWPFLRQKSRYLLAAVAVFAGLLVAEGSYLGRMREAFDSQRPLVERFDRLAFWDVHWNIFADHPLRGAGLAADKALMLDYYDRYGYNQLEHKYSAHNIYLQTLADTGVLGALGLLALLFGCWSLGRTFGDHRSSYRAFLITTLAAGLLQNTLRDSEFMVCFWICIGLFWLRFVRPPLGDETRLDDDRRTPLKTNEC